MNTSFVSAPGSVSRERFRSGSWEWHITGAWVTRREGRRVWVTWFSGTHQRVPRTTSGRTPGRSLRAMRRVLAVARIPAVLPS